MIMSECEAYLRVGSHRRWTTFSQITGLQNLTFMDTLVVTDHDPANILRDPLRHLVPARTCRHDLQPWLPLFPRSTCSPSKRHSTNARSLVRAPHSSRVRTLRQTT